jgi:hypothetical protein
MATTGIKGFYVETRNYGATGAFWKSLGFEAVFETGHSGHWVHPDGGPYVFINEQPNGDQALDTHAVLGVQDAAAFAPDRAVDWVKPFRNEHWGEAHALIRDPDGRNVALQAPAIEK